MSTNTVPVKSYVPTYQGGDRAAAREFQSISLVLRQIQNRLNGLTSGNSLILGPGDSITLITSDGLKGLILTAAYDPIDGTLVLKQQQLNIGA